MELIPFSPDPLSVLKRSPQALFVALFRPYLWETKNLLHLAASLENILILLIIIICIYKFSIQVFLASPVHTFLLISGLLILIIAAFTTPVAGTLVRLKMPGILLLLTGLASSLKKPYH